MPDTNGVRWDRQPFGVERRCTCARQSAECRSAGWHLVDGWSTLAEAQADAAAMTLKVGVAYRVVDSNGKAV